MKLIFNIAWLDDNVLENKRVYSYPWLICTDKNSEFYMGLSATMMNAKNMKLPKWKEYILKKL